MKKRVKSITEINKMADKHAQSWLGVHTSKYMTNGELLPKYKVHYESFLEGALSRQDELKLCLAERPSIFSNTLAC